MRTHLGITISEPCHEKWQEMTPTSKGKHCASCEKEVIDFTSLTKKEIHARITNGENICGRFRKDQLNTPLYLEPSKTRQWKKYAVSLLFPAALFITNEGAAKHHSTLSTVKNITPTSQITKEYKNLEIGTLSRNQNTSNQKLYRVAGIIIGNHSLLSTVTIQIKGTDRYVTTGLYGEYEIYAAKGDILIFSRTGFESKEVVYENQKTITLNLKPTQDYFNDFIMGDISPVEEPSKND